MSISASVLEKKSKWEPEFDFSPGEAVTVVKNQNPKEGIYRRGRVVWVGEFFVCIWICSLVAPEKHGWRECFFYSDITNGTVSIEKRKNNKKGA